MYSNILFVLICITHNIHLACHLACHLLFHLLDESHPANHLVDGMPDDLECEDDMVECAWIISCDWYYRM
jgi:hypothetical protein